MMAEMSEMELDNRRKRLIFRSEHRGTKEMDLLMGSFARQYLAGMSEAEVDAYEALMENPDPDIYNWITKVEPVPAEWQGPLMEKLQAHQVV